jgi:7-keto-8-aminopelargonate synthetase-like enzyme
MLDVEDRLAELEELGIHRRMRMVSGPQGPRVVLDGRPVLLLCSDNYLGRRRTPPCAGAPARAPRGWPRAR